MIAIMIGYLAICLLVPIGWVFKLIGLVIVAALVGTTIFVMVERIKEIRSGELDDLSKY